MSKKKLIMLIIIFLLVIGGLIAGYLIPQYERSKCEEEFNDCLVMMKMGFQIDCMSCD